jgi:transcriptional regulator with XRE-family HTH domain
MNIGSTIKTIRTKLGLSQKQIYERCNIDPSSYSKIENGVRDASVEQLRAISSCFCLSIDELLRVSESNDMLEAFTNVLKVKADLILKGTPCTPLEQLKSDLDLLDEEDLKLAVGFVKRLLINTQVLNILKR